MAPGAPFELSIESARGVPMQHFKHRERVTHEPRLHTGDTVNGALLPRNTAGKLLNETLRGSRSSLAQGCRIVFTHRPRRRVYSSR
jgi:hypothetical protein